MAIIELGELLADQPDLANPGATVANNCLPAALGYRPLKRFQSTTDAIDSRPLGAKAATSADSDTHIYAGDATKLYELDANNAWQDVSKAGGYTSTANFWDFSEYGGIMIATNFADNPQKFDMDNDTLFSDLTTAFKAKCGAVVRDFMMFGNTIDTTDGHVANRVRWSALGDYTDYTVSATTQADFQDTPGGGAVVRIFGGEYGVIFFERSIYRVTYVGSPIIFQFDEIEPGHGLYAQGAAAQNGEDIFYLDTDGFYVFNGQRSQPIGNEKVDNFFFSELDESYIDRISCAIDPENKLCIWSYPGPNNVSGKPNRLAIYDYEVRRWTFADVDNDLVFPVLSKGFTVEGLDNIEANLDLINISLDSRALTGGALLLGVFNSFKLGAFSGTPYDATLESKELQMYPGQRALATECWPLIDGGTTTVQIGTRNRLQDSYSWSSAASVNATGFAPLRAEGRYHRVRFNITGSWTTAQGGELMGTKRGFR